VDKTSNDNRLGKFIECVVGYSLAVFLAGVLLYFKLRQGRRFALAQRIQKKLGDRLIVVDRPCRSQMDPAPSLEEIDRWFSDALGRPCSRVFNVRKLQKAWVQCAHPMYVYRLPREMVYIETGMQLIGHDLTPFETCILGAQFLMFRNSSARGCSYLHEPVHEDAWAGKYACERNTVHLFEQVHVIPEDRLRVRKWPAETTSQRSPTGSREGSYYAVLIDAAMSHRPSSNSKDSFWFWTWDLGDALEEAELFNERYGLGVCVARLVANLR
jgi:hypothetical protein